MCNYFFRVSDPPTMDEFVHALATAGLAEAVRLLDVGCRAGSDVEVTASLPQSCSVAVAAHGCVQCRVGCPAAWRAAMGDGDTWPLVIPMPHSLRRAGMATPVLRMLVACVAPGAGLAPRAQTSTPSSCCGKQPGGWASTTFDAVPPLAVPQVLFAPPPPAEPPPCASPRVRYSARS